MQSNLQYTENVYNLRIMKNKLSINIDLNRWFIEEDKLMTNLLMKTCYTSLAIMEMQIQITVNYHNIPIRMT